MATLLKDCEAQCDPGSSRWNLFKPQDRTLYSAQGTLYFCSSGPSPTQQSALFREKQVQEDQEPFTTPPSPPVENAAI